MKKYYFFISHFFPKLPWPHVGKEVLKWWKHKRLRSRSSPTVTSTPSTPPLPPHVGWVVSGCAVVRWPPYLLPLTGAQKIHNHSALCQTDNPQHKPGKYVCVHVYVYLLLCTNVCTCPCVLCLRGGGEDKRGSEGAEGIWRKKGNGVVGVAEWVEIVIIIFFTAVWRRLGDLWI